MNNKTMQVNNSILGVISTLNQMPEKQSQIKSLSSDKLSILHSYLYAYDRGLDFASSRYAKSLQRRVVAARKLLSVEIWRRFGNLEKPDGVDILF